jgi:hypothetical protein
VQLLRSAAALVSTDGTPVEGYVAALSGVPAIPTAPYDPDTKTVNFPASVPSEYTDATDTPQLYLRVWQDWLQGNQLGQPVSLPGTGLRVTVTLAEAQAKVHVGDLLDNCRWAFLHARESAVLSATCELPEVTARASDPRC